MNYTKGEWKASLPKGSNGWLEIASEGEEVATVYQSTTKYKANARLIAQSPRMLEALKEARITLNVLQPQGSAILREIDAVLAKVEEKC